jgi:CRISPR-associated protein (TIGR03986 family)
MIIAPYNFVPLNEKVFYPFWDKNVSHDIPFLDGESAMLSIKVTAETPIYIRNHYTDGDDYYEDKKKNKISTEFCHFRDSDGGKQYYIPSSSIKGMIRNIVEIMSFSKINIDEKVLSKPLSVRDMTQDKKTGQIFSHDMVATAKKCGFLIKEGDNYYIEDCGNVVTIKEQEIQNLIPDYRKDIETAEEKYKQFGHNDAFPFETMTKDRRTIALYNQRGSVGSLVMTGFIDNKKNEFIFKATGKKLPIGKILYEDFEKVYFENEDVIDGQYWKREWKSGEGRKIPIFYIEKDKQISAIGLTQIFKLAYKKTLLDASYQTTQKDRLDLAETMFGTVKENMALKGRIQFSHLKSTHVSYEREKSEILGSPQATYYPNYLEQTKVNGDKVNSYITLMESSAQIAGYKRYPLHKGIKKSFIPKEEKTDIQTKFKPLNQGAIFNGKVRFHNLKKAEIGALLSALTFHGHDGYRHNLGMGKALGYGKVKIDIELQGLEYTKKEYLKAYEEEMTIFEDDWIESSQLKELFAMANNEIINDKSLEYQKLENPTTRDKEKNDFVRAKKSKEYLKRYSQIGNVNQVELESFVDKSKIEEEKKAREVEQERLALLEEKEKAQKLQEERDREKERAEKKKEEDKWKAIQKVDKKFYKKALEDFIANYGDSTFVSDAKKELESLGGATVTKSTNQGLDFSKANDGKSIERAMKTVQNPSEEDKQKLEEVIQRVYPSLNAKKKKQFAKMKLMVKWLGNDRFNGLLE